jgi:hypothetical protein
MKHIIVMLVLLSLVSLSWAQEASEKAPVYDKNSWGLGFGIPYGVLGGNIDVNVAPNLNISFGIGTTIVAGIGYNAGLKYFFSSVENTLRPRILAFYGVNAMSSIGDDNESYTGLSIGAGFQWMWGDTKSNGLDIDIIYVATTGYDLDELEEEYGDRYVIEEYGKVKFSIGYRHAF